MRSTFKRDSSQSLLSTPIPQHPGSPTGHILQLMHHTNNPHEHAMLQNSEARFVPRPSPTTPQHVFFISFSGGPRLALSWILEWFARPSEKVFFVFYPQCSHGFSVKIWQQNELNEDSRLSLRLLLRHVQDFRPQEYPAVPQHSLPRTALPVSRPGQ